MSKKFELFFLLALTFVGATRADNEIKVGGFVDAQWGWTRSGGVALLNSFYLNEGALYLNGSLGSADAMLDIPFVAKSALANALTLGQTKAQAWVGYRYANGFHYKIGQFDSIYGSEGKDTVLIPFTQHSMLLTKGFLPWTQTGLILGYQVDKDWSLDAVIANPNGMSHMSAGNPDFGIKLGGEFKEAGVEEISVGFRAGRTVPGNFKPWMVSAILGLHFGDLDLRGDGFIKKTGIPGDKVSMGLGGYALYALSSKISYGLRLVLVSKSTEKLEFTTGPQFQVHKNIVTKLDYTFANNVAKVKSHGVAAAALYKF